MFCKLKPLQTLQIALIFVAFLFMLEKEKIALLICHCSFPQKLARTTRILLQEALPDVDLKVKVICPSEHKKHITSPEQLAEITWPKEKTSELLRKYLHETDILLAAGPVIELIRDFKPISLKTGWIGDDPFGQIKKMPAQLKRIFFELGIQYRQTKFDENINLLILELVKSMNLKIKSLLSPNLDHLEQIKLEMEKLGLSD